MTADLRGFTVTCGYRGSHPCSGGGCGICSGHVEYSGILNLGVVVVTNSALFGNVGPDIVENFFCGGSGVTVTNSIIDGECVIASAGISDGYNIDDQRGVSRPQGNACDVGGFELEQ